MTRWPVARWTATAHPAAGVAAERARDWGHGELYDRLLGVCLLLLLRERPDALAQLPERLRPLGLDASVEAVAGALGRLERDGLVRAAETEDGAGPARYAVTAEGVTWLRAATSDLRRTEAVLGGFLARCGERLVSPT